MLLLYALRETNMEKLSTVEEILYTSAVTDTTVVNSAFNSWHYCLPFSAYFSKCELDHSDC